MGVKLEKIISPLIISLKELEGKKVAIDGMNMLYQILYNPFQMQKKLPDIFYLDRTQRVITHLYGWIQKITHFYQAKIFPIVVFDGKPDERKYPGQMDRARTFITLEKKYHESLKSGNKAYTKQLEAGCFHCGLSHLKQHAVPFAAQRRLYSADTFARRQAT